VKGPKVSAGDRTPAVTAAEGRLRPVIRDFLRKRGAALALEVAADYRKLSKDDADKVREIMDALNLGDWTSLTDAAQQELIEVFQAGGEAALAGLLREASASALFGALNPAAADYAATRGAELVTQITDSTRAGLSDLIESAFSDGLSPTQLAEEIRSSYWFSEARADMIARTELSMAHVQGSIQGWKDSGVVAGKSILLSADHEEDECDDDEGEGIIPIDQEFEDGDPPFHPNCLVGGSVVSAAGVTAQMERRYEGKIVRLLIEGMDQLAITPNHPVLSRRGWIAAGELKKGDELIQCSDPALAVRLLNPDDHHVETRIEEIASALLVAGGVAARPVPVTAEDFHGDAGLESDEFGRHFADEKVNVIWAASRLENEVQSATRQRAGEGMLRGAHGGGGVLPGASAHDEFRAVDLAPPNGSVGGFRPCRPDLGPGAASLDSSSFRVGTDGVAVPLECLPDCEAIAAEAFRKIDARLAGLIRAVKVLDVAFEDFCGQVYNLSTETGWYLAAGLVTSNCNCSVIPELIEGYDQEEEAA
jgi:hypothetical protein